jgi:beta-lactamase regulating signal transducer with metallopeptidase domain
MTAELSGWTAITLLGDHLWQSTLVAAAAGLVALALKNNRAQVRHQLWLVASLKFLVPFGALAAVGRQFGGEPFAPTVMPDLIVVIDAMSQPFSRPSASMEAAGLPPLTASDPATVPLILLLIWICGLVAVVCRWLVRWRHVAELVRQGSPLYAGRETEALRRLEQISGIGKPLQLVSTDMAVEPAVFGILRPVLLWPRRMGEHLDGGQIMAILAHELSHVRRRDNLVAAVHMIIQAVFWFHPLVWWVGARLLQERERSCDEDVIELGNEPEVYAESLIETCRFYVAAPVNAVSGVSGSDLGKRIEAIMSPQAGRALNGWKNCSLPRLQLRPWEAPSSLACSVGLGSLLKRRRVTFHWNQARRSTWRRSSRTSPASRSRGS